MGYLGNGLTITGTQNSKRIVVDATPNQTISTVTGGYLTGQLDVYRNGVKLVDTQDYTASDGSSVTFLNAVSEGDELEFVVFENFDVANALSNSGGTVSGDLVVTGIATFNSDVSIGGTLTYEDVTNIDSVGLITARSGVEIGTPGIAATLTAAGGAVFTGVVTATNINTSTLAEFTGGVGIADSIFHIGDTDTAIRFPGNDTFTVETSGSEALRIDGSQRLLMGRTSTAAAANRNSNIQLHSNDASEASITIRRFFVNTDDNAPPRLILARSGSNSDDFTIVANDNRLGEITFAGADGTDLRTEAANIRAEVDGTPGSNDMPGRLIFSTTADGVSDYTERLRIDSGGGVGIGTTNPVLGRLQVERDIGIYRVSSDPTLNFAVGGTSDSPAKTYRILIDDDDSDKFQVRDSNTARITLDGSGRVLVGATQTRTNVAGQTLDHLFEEVDGTLRFGLVSGTTNTSSPILALCKHRGTTAGSLTAVNSGDNTGVVMFTGSDGTNFLRSAQITSVVDGTPGTDDMPGRLEFSTTADGASTPTERLRITSGGLVRVTDDASLTFGDGDDMRIYHDGGTGNYIDVYNKDFYIRCNKDAGITGGDILLQPKSGENSAIFRDNGAVELYYDNAKKLETYSEGIEIFGDEGASAGIRLTADEGDDNGDSWRINSNQDVNDLTISNDTSGSYVDKLTLTTGGNLTLTGTISDSIGDVRRLGVTNHDASTLTLTTAHAGNLIREATNGANITLPQNVFSAGDMITIFNRSTGDNTITQGTGVTLYNSADASTGNRTLAAKGLCTIACTASNEFIISGSNLS